MNLHTCWSNTPFNLQWQKTHYEYITTISLLSYHACNTHTQTLPVTLWGYLGQRSKVNTVKDNKNQCSELCC